MPLPRRLMTFSPSSPTPSEGNEPGEVLDQRPQPV